MIYLRPLAGLCNRLRVMSAAMSLARTAKTRLKVYWKTDPEMNAKFADLFEPIPVSPTELFVSRMEQELVRCPKVRFFVATDDCPTKELLKRHFGEHIVTREQVAERNAQNGARDALIDLMLLSRCSRIFGSYWSSFSGVAAKIGGCPLEVLKVG